MLYETVNETHKVDIPMKAVVHVHSLGVASICYAAQIVLAFESYFMMLSVLAQFAANIKATIVLHFSCTKKTKWKGFVRWTPKS